MIFSAGLVTAQEKSAGLNGYWMEKESENELSLSTLLVFDMNVEGKVEGQVYFLESDNRNRSFTLDKIHIEGNSFSFQIRNTTISFHGEMNSSGSMCSGTFLLDGEKSFEVNHQKLSGENLKHIIGLPDMKKRIIRKHVAADDGLVTS